MIAKTEDLLSVADILSTKSSNGYNQYQQAVAISKDQVDQLALSQGLALEQVLRTAWALLQHIYTGASIIDLHEVNHDGLLEGNWRYMLDTRQTLLDQSRNGTFEVFARDHKFTFNASGVAFDRSIEYKGHRKTDGGCVESPRLKSLKQTSLIGAFHVESGQIVLTILFDIKTVPTRQATGYWHTFQKILRCVVENGTQNLATADFLSDFDKKQLIAWNQPVPYCPEDLTICSVFTYNLARRPHAPAVFAWDGQLTYQQLDETSSTLSSRMIAHGIKPGTLVPFCMEKSKWALISTLAILKSGAAVVPTDPAWPEQRMAAILKATSAEFVVCSAQTLSVLDTGQVKCFNVTNEIKNPVTSTADSRMARPKPSDVAFVLFSSGSTGVPKGMIREHRTACIASIAHAEAMNMDESSRVLQFANHVFDVAMLDFFTTLIAGGCVCIPSEVERRNDLAGFIQRSQANWVLLTPTVADILDPRTVPSLKFVTLGGEAIAPELLDKWLAHCRVGMNYGSAEVDVTQACDVHDSRDPANVGSRLRSCVTYIVDPENVHRILPIGAVGELLISGPTMARSYLNNPEKTKSAFISAPVDWYLRDDEGIERDWMKRAYRMGDLLQQLPDGSFRFIGRKDFQVKVHGQKVELGDIEAQLKTHPSVEFCAVLYPREGPLTDRLVAVVQTRRSSDSVGRRQNGSLTETLLLRDLKQYLESRLPSFMLPQVCINADPMPLTATMKIDRTKLKSWIVEEEPVKHSHGVLKHISNMLQGEKLQSSETSAINISGLVADLVCAPHSEVWNSIFEHENSFSDIGVDSVMTMRIARQVEKMFGVKVAVETLTDRRMSIRYLASVVEDSKLMGSASSENQMSASTLRKKVKLAFHEAETLRQSLQHENTNNAIDGMHQRDMKTKSIFMTGATGFLGGQILSKCLALPDVDRVCLLVRGPDMESQRRRLLDAVARARGNVEAFATRVELWAGDLGQTRLGLDPVYWRQLTISGNSKDAIDVIIHCGAIVDWTRSYSDLEAANVRSTIELLGVTLAADHERSLVYIAGGQYFQPGADDMQVDFLWEEAAASTGYAQTKFVSEQLIRTAATSCDDKPATFVKLCTFKPAYLIGSEMDGFANTDDYLWRLVAAAVKAGCYNADEDLQWLLVADISCVATQITELAMRQSTLSTALDFKVLDGIMVRDFWNVVSEKTGRRLRQCSSKQWMDVIRKAMEEDPNHVLWPLLEAFEKSSGLLTSMQLPSETMQERTAANLHRVIKSNVQHLQAIGFLEKYTR